MDLNSLVVVAASTLDCGRTLTSYATADNDYRIRDFTSSSSNGCSMESQGIIQASPELIGK